MGGQAHTAGSTAHASEYGKQVAQRLCPIMLPYDLGSEAAFDFIAFNGRDLTDDVMDVMLTIASNTALADGVAPNKARVQPVFPYVGPAYTAAEQAGVAPAVRRPAPSDAKPQRRRASKADVVWPSRPSLRRRRPPSSRGSERR